MKPTTWRQILKKHQGDFRGWLRATRRDEIALTAIASQLAGFIIEGIDGVRHEWPDAPVEFWNRIPDVRACCSDLETFEKPFAVEAYAYVHFLERYRRTWAMLDRLTGLAVLPMGTRGVRVLDVGTGPACSLYAIDDFYAALVEFSSESGIPELNVPPPELACVEKSRGMVRFFHHFSEYMGRRGPFGPISGDFSTLDLEERRRFYRNQNEYERYWDDETQQYDELYDPVFADAEAERLFRYRLVILSNFLTAEGDVERFRERLLSLFIDLKAGGVALVLGGTGDKYEKIYDKVAAIAHEAGLIDPAAQIDKTHLGRSDAAAIVIKGSQHRVYRYLADTVGADRLARDSSYPDYWTPKPSTKAKPKFAFRLFRAGRWPNPRIVPRSKPLKSFRRPPVIEDSM